MNQHSCIFCGCACDCESVQDECFGCARCIQERNAAQEESDGQQLLCDESGWIADNEERTV